MDDSQLRREPGSPFLGNLLLTRLLFPEAFGLIVIVQTIITGYTMLSDLGIEQSIIYNPHANRREFLNTAWTVNIGRSIILWIAISLFARPFAAIYGTASNCTASSGCRPWSRYRQLQLNHMVTAERELRIARASVINVGTYLIGLACMILLAWQLRSVWSLVLGNVIASTLRTTASHLLMPGIVNRFALDRKSLTEMTRFGRWIFLGTALTFFAGEGNRLLMGTLLAVSSLGFLISQSRSFNPAAVNPTTRGKGPVSSLRRTDARASGRRISSTH